MITRGNPWGAESRRNPYPFVDIATFTDSSGILRIDPAAITDAKLWPAVTSTSRVYLSSITRGQGSLVITVSTLDAVVGVATITDLTKRRVAFWAPDGSQSGYMAFSPGGLQGLHDVPTRTYEFPVAATEFVASAVAPRATGGVKSLGDAAGNTLDGVFRIVGGEGVRLNAQPNGFRVDIVGDPYFRREACADPKVLGRALVPVRAVHYRDLLSGLEGRAVPYAGNITVTIIGASEDPKARGYVSPGPEKTLLSRIGG